MKKKRSKILPWTGGQISFSNRHHSAVMHIIWRQSIRNKYKYTVYTPFPLIGWYMVMTGCLRVRGPWTETSGSLAQLVSAGLGETSWKIPDGTRRRRETAAEAIHDQRQSLPGATEAQKGARFVGSSEKRRCRRGTEEAES